MSKASRGLQQSPMGCVLHDEERQAVFSFTQLVDRQNVWMAKACYRHSFASKPRKCFARISVNAQDAFQSDDALRVSLARSIDHAHPATPDFLKDPVIADTPFGTANINFVEHVIPVPCVFALVLEPLLQGTT